MKYKFLSVIFILCALTWPLSSTAQDQPSNAETQAPVLTLDEAVSLALQHNRLVKNSVLEAQKYDFRVNTALSQRKPQFHFSILGGEFLNSFNFTVPAGSLGTFASTGPVPATNAKIHNAAVPTAFLNASIAQPLTQQYKIGLGIHAT